MKAIVINQYGGSEVLEYKEDIPVPKCGANQVLISVKASSINPLDWKTRAGDLRYILNSNFPLILGNDVSGTIVKVADDVEGFSVGDDVYCMLDANIKPSLNGFAKSGGYAEYAVTRAGTLCMKPQCLSHVEAAAVPLAALTAYQSLSHIAKIQIGQKVLINGASGGVGLFAVQIAKAFGAEVVAVCSERNKALLLDLGADSVIDYRKTDFTQSGTQYDVVYDVVSNKSFKECRNVLTNTGVFIYNVPSLYSLISPLFYPLACAFGRKKRLRHAWVKSSGEDLKAIRQLIEEKKVRPVVGSVFSLAEAMRAHDAGEGSKSHGKIVLGM